VDVPGPEAGQVIIEPLLRDGPIEHVDALPFADALEDHLGLNGMADMPVVVAVHQPNLN
jgi:hypothetical protein